MTDGSAIRGFDRGETARSESFKSRAELLPPMPGRGAKARSGLDWHEFFVRLGEGTLPKLVATAR
jgi:hypothetical protein